MRIRKIRHQSNPKINTTSSFTKCHECGELVSKSELFDSKYCENCYNTIKLAKKLSFNRCGNCHEYFNPSLSPDPHHCPECLKKIKKCENCGNDFIPKEKILLCPICYSEKVRTCQICKKDFIPKTKSRSICSKCLKKLDKQKLKKVPEKRPQPKKKIESPNKTCKLLIKALDDKNIENQKFAEDSLIKMGSDSVEVIIQSLNCEGKNKRRQLVDILVKMEEDSIDYLIESLDDFDYLIKKSCAKALGLIGDEKAVEPLIKTLDDPDSFVRRSSIKALGLIGDESAIEPIIDTLLNDENSYVKIASATALGKFNDKRAINALEQGLDDGNHNVIIRCLKSLIELDIDTSLKFLIENLNNPDQRVVEFSKKAIISIKDEEYLDKLLKEIIIEPKIKKSELLKLIENLFVDDPDVRKNTAIKLGSSSYPEAAEYLIDAIDDSNEDVKLEVIKALGKLKNLKTLKILIDTLLDDDPFIRWTAEEAVANFGLDAIPIISKCFECNAELRYYLVAILGEIKGEDSEKLLIEALYDQDDDVRKKAIESLAKVGTNNSINPLFERLDDEPKRGFKKKIIKTIVKICQEKDLEAFENALLKNFPNERKLVNENIEKAKNRIKKQKAREEILEESKDPDLTIQKLNNDNHKEDSENNIDKNDIRDHPITLDDFNKK